MKGQPLGYHTRAMGVTRFSQGVASPFSPVAVTFRLGERIFSPFPFSKCQSEDDDDLEVLAVEGVLLGDLSDVLSADLEVLVPDSLAPPASPPPSDLESEVLLLALSAPFL